MVYTRRLEVCCLDGYSEMHNKALAVGRCR